MRVPSLPPLRATHPWVHSFTRQDRSVWPAGARMLLVGDGGVELLSITGSISVDGRTLTVGVTPEQIEDLSGHATVELIDSQRTLLHPDPLPIAILEH